MFCYVPSPAFDCGTLTDPANGMVDVSQGTTLGQVANYTCIGGYQLIGERTRTCEAGGWSGNAPTCGKFTHIIIYWSCTMIY